ncbi:hypothetical protein [Micromonospora yangpuensis]|uniref:Uncharacterized protein n=1 Tax=Micromonospora yangpuensis TaxID=683228 RepID=A0A1C6UW93_9ACTN|nr:hypothetical protein [Micromonospora yangpuensis]GGM25437.1 hypothetical protein GCM10012279_49860 [Micromonospora yangpuensis]SCL58315.1 hypothetical protein GA0070617_3782 [Micromonospora yangpuensis]
MSESRLEFRAHHRPVLPAGDYQVTVSQQVSLEPEDFTVTRRFTVAGDRFGLAPSLIRAVFPPHGSVGDHGNVLPHVVLERATLPWERSPVGDDPAAAPWLALLLFSEDERPEPHTVPLGQLGTDSWLPAAASTPERHESGQDPVTVIDVPLDLLTELLPDYAELPLLAHVRAGDGDAAEAAVVVGNRLPTPGGTSTVHLVSLEHRFRTTGDGPAVFDPGPAPGGGRTHTVRLVSLTSWRFASVSADHTFATLVRDLADDGGTLRLPPAGGAAVDRYLAAGFVPLRHQLRQGGRSIGWYRGPLVPGPTDGGPVAPTRTGDALLRFDTELGMFDLGYAAAWQLGRLLALSSGDVATGLYGWRRRRDQRAKQQVDPGYPLAVAPIDDTLPAGVLDWLTGLTRLDGIPLTYLVPDERLLPAETIRFLGVDQTWVRHLLDGATSIGRLGPADEQRDAVAPVPVDFPTVTGALIRSDVVSGYPALLVDGYADLAGRQPLVSWGSRRLAPDILLCLFTGDQLARLDLHQPPEAQHLAVEPDASGTSFGRMLRAPGGTDDPPGHLGPLPFGPRGTVPMRELAGAVAQALGRPAAEVDAGDLALQLTETAERVTFLRVGSA